MIRSSFCLTIFPHLLFFRVSVNGNSQSWEKVDASTEPVVVVGSVAGAVDIESRRDEPGDVDERLDVRHADPLAVLTHYLGRQGQRPASRGRHLSGVVVRHPAHQIYEVRDIRAHDDHLVHVYFHTKQFKKTTS